MNVVLCLKHGKMGLIAIRGIKCKSSPGLAIATAEKGDLLWMKSFSGMLWCKQSISLFPHNLSLHVSRTGTPWKGAGSPWKTPSVWSSVLGDQANFPSAPTSLFGDISHRPLLYCMCIHGLLSGSSHPWHPASVPVMEILIKISPTVSNSTCACRDGTSLLQGFGTSASCTTTVPCLQPAELWDASFSWGIPRGAY